MHPVIIEIHTEPDSYYLSSEEAEEWHGFEIGYKVLLDVKKKHPDLRLTWLFRADLQIGGVYDDCGWALKRYKKEIDELEASGDEIGLHMHPFKFENNKTLEQNFNDLGHLKNCMEQSVKAFKSAMGYAAETISVSMGTTRTPLVNYNRSLGLKYDLTLNSNSVTHFPEHLGKFAGERSSGNNFPQRVYTPSEEDYTKEDVNSDDYKMIPVPCWKVPAHVSLKNRIGRAIRGEGAFRMAKLTLAMQPKHFRKIVDESVQNSDYLVVSTRVHIFNDEIKSERALENLCYLIGHQQVETVTPKNWVPQVKSKY